MHLPSPKKSTFMAKSKWLASIDEIHPQKGMVVLQPIAMRIPNSYGVYSPSKLEPLKKISYEEFLSHYADHPRKIRVCFDEKPSWDTLLERSELVTAYGFGLDCWYIMAANGTS